MVKNAIIDLQQDFVRPKGDNISGKGYLYEHQEQVYVL
jgi:hypothetical protein